VGRHRLDTLVEGEETVAGSPGRRLRPVLAVVLGVVVSLLVGLAAWAIESGADRADPAPGPGDPALAVPGEGDLGYTAGVGTGAPETSAGPTPVVEQSLVTVAPARFSADYETTARLPSGFRGQVMVRNVGAQAGTWTVVVVLPPASSLSQVANAGASRTGHTIRFRAPAQLAPGDSASFSFEVTTKQAASGPQSCSIDGRPCT
jgi:hypothetical protein